MCASFPNFLFRNGLLSVLLSLKESTISLLITVNYKCKGQHSLVSQEKTMWAECCKLENVLFNFPSRNIP